MKVTRISSWAPTIATAAVLAGAASASAATTYCVHHDVNPCDGLSGTLVDENGDLQAALTDAGGADGNTVLIGPGTFAGAGGFVYSSATNAVTIRGAAGGQTQLTATGANVGVLGVVGPGGTTVSDLTIAMTAETVNAGLEVSGPTASATTGAAATRIVVTAPGSSSYEPDAALVANGASLTYSRLDAGLGNGSAIATDGTVALSDVAARGNFGVLTAGGDVSAQRLTIVARTSAIGATPGTVTADGMLAVVAQGPAVWALDGADITVRSATFVGSANNTARIRVDANSAGAHTAATVLDSVFHGFDEPFSCQAPGAGSTAKLTLGNDDVVTAPGSCSGSGVTFDPGTGNITADPRFVDLEHGDARLRFDSPAIDAGGAACQALCAASDIDGLTRPIDGNGDGSAVRDMGAFEYGRRAPTVTASADRASATSGGTITYTATGTDPDHGDTLTYAWSFDDGASATGASVTHAFTTAGSHTATVTASDPTAQTARASAIVTVAAAAPPLVTPPVVIKDTTAPKLSNVAFSPSKFKVSSKSTATSARKATAKGSTLKFTLGERATVVVTIIKPRGGVKSGKSCKAPSKKHPVKHPRKCDLTVGTITRKNQAATADKLAFSGRIGHKALAKGKYKASLTATDTAGNRSKATTATFTIV
jgi:PKD repeat protein